MKIKLAILEKDASYLMRIVSVFSTKYSDKFEIYSFTDEDVAYNTLSNTKIDVFLASDVFDVDMNRIPKRSGFAYLVDSSDVETVNNQRAICKFQKVDLIYKQILSLYAEHSGNNYGIKLGDNKTPVIVFSSPCGGVGTSTVAASCAQHFSSQGAKTLYLNLEKFGESDVFFSAHGQFSMSDIIFALKSRKSNLSLKLESCVEQDDAGVCFYSKTQNALDMMELKYEEIIRLISELKITSSYSYIIIDMDFVIEKGYLDVLRAADAVVWVCDGSEIAVSKTVRALSALMTMEQNNESAVTNKLSLIYNKFSNKSSVSLDISNIKVLGGMPKYEHADTKQLLSRLSQSDTYDKILLV